MGDLPLTTVRLYERLRRIPIQSRRGQEPIRLLIPLVMAVTGYIDPAACYLDVGSSYPRCAAASKGGVVRPLKFHAGEHSSWNNKGNVSWV